MTSEKEYQYFAKGDGPGSYYSLFFKTEAWGREYRWDKTSGFWKPTTLLMDMLYKMELSLDQVSYDEAQKEFPDAFPVKISNEGE